MDLQLKPIFSILLYMFFIGASSPFYCTCLSLEIAWSRVLVLGMSRDRMGTGIMLLSQGQARRTPVRLHICSCEEDKNGASISAFWTRVSVLKRITTCLPFRHLACSFAQAAHCIALQSGGYDDQGPFPTVATIFQG
jgi:hypothetical protein